MAKALRRLITKKRKLGHLHGMKPGPNCELISHHQFIDDTIMIGKSLVREAKSFMDALKLYEYASHEKVNFQKMNLFFFNTPMERQKKLLKFSIVRKVHYLRCTWACLYLLLF